MPSFTFVLPHWVYWGTLLVFPLVAMYMVTRQRRLGAPREPILFNAYLFWITSGFMGLHRMYLKSWWGFLYVPFFVAVLYCNGEVRDSREDVSRTTAELEQAQRSVKVAEPIDAAAPTAEERQAVADAQASCASTRANTTRRSQSRITGRASPPGSRWSWRRCWSSTRSFCPGWCGDGAPTQKLPAMRRTR
jgi:hypothetical protein